ncbi:hypothetical protein MMC20_002368 [Loxospora ochrophaea]|nr:hypothetical protein [Loxospora ochrophaea]
MKAAAGFSRFTVAGLVTSVAKAVVASNPSRRAVANCTVTEYSAVPSAVASCTAITLENIAVPPESTLDLSKLIGGTTVIFSGITTFGFYPWTGSLIDIGGTNITITSTPNAIIDGNGQAWWDGQGSNGGIDKPDHFIAVSNVLGSSTIENLYIQNWPTHCFSISGSTGLTIRNITLNNLAGNAPNANSSGLAAAHNTDGFDISSSSNVLLTDSVVYNQDDCVAITSGDQIVTSNLYCDGSHGLSIGSVGGKSNNNVTNIYFQDSTVVNSQNGCRIKTNYNTTGFISNIEYRNIALSNISIYGIDVQQDYLNGGPTGIPSNGVTISGVLFENVTGTAESTAKDYYVLCGSRSCSNFTFVDVDITGGTNNSCNYEGVGSPC